MSPVGFLLIAVVLALPLAWLVAEFRGSRQVRVVLGIVTLGGIAFCVWGLSSVLNRFNYNAWYGGATGDLIKTSIHQIEDGHLDRVLKVWRGLDQQYQPTYEHRAHYNELVEQATRRMKGEQPIGPGSAWDASAFNSETWVGHWEDDNGYWLVVNDVDRPFDVVRSGDPPTKMQSVAVSPDYTVLKFKEGELWSHTLKLSNKYEATHEWFDVAKGTIWKTETMHKLIRAAEEQKKMTKQEKPTSQLQ